MTCSPASKLGAQYRRRLHRDRDIVTVAEAADRLGVRADAVRHWLRSHRVAGGWLYADGYRVRVFHITQVVGVLKRRRRVA